MNKKINLVELLRDCPKGTKFYSRALGTVTFNCIKSDMICINDHKGIEIAYAKSGKYYYAEEDSVIDLFPSRDQRDWSKWQRPFVDGDFVVQGEHGQIFILKEINDVNKSDYRGKCYIGYDYKNCEIYPKGDWWFDKHATEEEKQRLIDTLKENGYEWDAEKKELKTLQSFKDGDIIYNSIQKRICICHYRNDETLCISHCRYNVYHKEFELLDKDLVIIKQDYRIATDEEKQILFDAIKENGYKWYSKTKTLEKLIVPKFKVGDTIRAKNGLQAYTITGATSEYYSVKVGEHACVGILPVKDQDDWILIPNKFDPKTLQHFDKVVVRQYNDRPWCTDFFSFYNEVEGYAVCTGEVHYDYCIPYNEDTKHLVGKSKDAPEFYRYWMN